MVINAYTMGIKSVWKKVTSFTYKQTKGLHHEARSSIPQNRMIGNSIFPGKRPQRQKSSKPLGTRWILWEMALFRWGMYTWVFSEMSFPRFDRLVLSDGGPLLIQYISDACVSSRQNDKQFFLYLKTHQRRLRGALLSWRYIGTWGWTVWGKWRKGKKSSCSEKSSSEKSRGESQKGHVVAHGHAVALEGRACAWACASLREACARFCPWFAKIICSPVSGTCLAEQSKPCANLAQTLRCLAVLLHLVGGPLLKENVQLANGTQMSRWSFFACYTFLESAHIDLRFSHETEKKTTPQQSVPKNHVTK